MNYNTEDFRRIAEEVAKLVQEGLRQTQNDSQPEDPMRDMLRPNS